MPGKIPADELTDETKAKIGLGAAEARIPPSQRNVSARVIALGEILQSLKGLTHRDALWALRQAAGQVELSARSEGYKDRTDGQRRKAGK